MALRLGSNVDLSKVVRNLGAKMRLVPHLDLAIGQEEFEWHFDYKPKTDDDAWHPSGDCTPTLHELYQKATGALEPRPIPPSLRKTFMVGHFWHQYLQWIVLDKLAFADPSAIERRGVKIWGWPSDPSAGNPGPAPYHWATGAGDVAPCSIPGDGDYAIDFKTQNSRAFAMPQLPDWCADKYEAQINIYMDFFDLERALIVCINKDTGDMREHEYRRNQPLIDAVYAKWRLVSACLDAQLEPPLDEDIPLPLQGPEV